MEQTHQSYNKQLNDLISIKKEYILFIKEYYNLIEENQELKEKFEILKYPLLLKMTNDNKEKFQVSMISRIFKEAYLIIAKLDVIAGFKFIDILTGYARVVNYVSVINVNSS